jgi:hypothetical protein
MNKCNYNTQKKMLGVGQLASITTNVLKYKNPKFLSIYKRLVPGHLPPPYA